MASAARSPPSPTRTWCSATSIPDAFAGGRIALAADKARQAVADNIGTALSCAPEMAAFAINEVVDENMVNAARVHAVERGIDTAGRTLVAFGGAAPLHACRIAEKLGIGRVVIPPDAGVGSAIGFLEAPAAFEIVRSRYVRLDEFDAAAANVVLDEITREATALAKSAAGSDDLQTRRQVFARYAGQGHEVAVDLPTGLLGAETPDLLRSAFEKEYDRLFARHIPNARIELMSWAVLVASPQARPEVLGAAAADVNAPEAPLSRNIFAADAGARAAVPLHDRAALKAGHSLTGPCVIAEAGTSTIVTDGFDVAVDGGGALVLTAKAKPKAATVEAGERAGGRHRHADHVEPIDRSGRGAGPSSPAHRVFADRARSRRSVGRYLRSRWPHVGPGRYRHAGPRQLDGRVGQAFHRPFRHREHARRRCLHHQ